VDFRQTIIVLTSNLGSDLLAAEGHDKDVEKVLKVVRSSFRPEFLNRLDEMLVFNRLGRDVMAAITEIQLNSLRRLLFDRHIEMSISDEAINWLADKGYDPVYGARPLRRVIQRAIQDPLANLLLEGLIADGGQIGIDVSNDGLKIVSQDISNKIAA
jgi:ATP-dependent Clp protease ATP-binding subunit ClpB